MKKFIVRETIIIEKEVEAENKKHAIEVARDYGISVYGDQVKDIFSARVVKEQEK